jgi:hypothetical protein
VFLGWMSRSLASPAAVLTGANLHGAVVRPELNIPLADGLLIVRLAPELIVVVGSNVTASGSVTSLSKLGLGLGGEVSLDLRLAKPLYLGLAYRESRVRVSSAGVTQLFDLEMYVLARATLQF